MNDAFGYPLTVGGRVMYASTGDNSRIYMGTIESMTDKTVLIRITHGDYRIGQTTRVSSWRLVTSEAMLDNPGQAPVG